MPRGFVNGAGMHTKFIGRILGIDKGTVRCVSKCYEALGAALGRNGRLSILGDERREGLVRQIEATCHHGIPWTTKILQFFQERAAEAVDKNSVYHWLHRESRITSCRGVPTEDRRLEITPEIIVDYFQ
jgi:transposase